MLFRSPNAPLTLWLALQRRSSATFESNCYTFRRYPIRLTPCITIRPGTRPKIPFDAKCGKKSGSRKCEGDRLRRKPIYSRRCSVDVVCIVLNSGMTAAHGLTGKRSSDNLGDPHSTTTRFCSSQAGQPRRAGKDVPFGGSACAHGDTCTYGLVLSRTWFGQRKSHSGLFLDIAV